MYQHYASSPKISHHLVPTKNLCSNFIDIIIISFYISCCLHFRVSFTSPFFLSVGRAVIVTSYVTSRFVLPCPFSYSHKTRKFSSKLTSILRKMLIFWMDTRKETGGINSTQTRIRRQLCTKGIRVRLRLHTQHMSGVVRPTNVKKM